MTKRVLVTGASGFVARALFACKLVDGVFVGISREVVERDGIAWRRGPTLSADADWAPGLDGIDAVVHLAGRVHRPAGTSPSAYFAENCEGTIKLAHDAKAAGVRHFVFLSTGKVLGDESSKTALAEDAAVRPGDPYAASKLAAEQALAQLGGQMNITILRPPLVYGPGVKANFLALLSAVARGVPLPLASIRNRRSLVGVDNLASAILACLESPASGARTYHITDGLPVSTPDLVRSLARALGRPPRLFPFPPVALEACGAALGRGDTVKRLTRSLELDDTAIRADLGWSPLRSFDAGIADTVRWYQSLAGVQAGA